LTDELEIVEEGLDAEGLREVLFKHYGNITKASEHLKVDSERLRKFVWAIPRLREAMVEIYERGTDRAVEVVMKGLDDKKSYQNRFYAAKEMLRSDYGRKRGFGGGEKEKREGASIGRPLGGMLAPPAIRWLEEAAPSGEDPGESKDANGPGEPDPAP
jgi:hypothetical protein